MFKSVVLKLIITSILFCVHINEVEGYQFQSDQTIFDNWIQIVESTYRSHSEHDPIIYTVLAHNFFDEFKKTDNPVYLNFALHEAGRSLRQDLIEKLDEHDKERILFVIKKLVHQEFTPELYKLREFTPKDIYLFHMHNIPQEYTDAARSLLDFWFDQLPHLYEEDVTRAVFLTQAMVMGYHRLNEYEKVVELSDWLMENDVLPPSLFSLNYYQLMVHPMFIRGEFSKLLHIFESSILPIAQELNDEEIYAQHRMDYATTMFQIGKINDALNEYNSILKEISSIEEFASYSILLNNIAISHLQLGNFSEYLDFQIRSYKIASELENYENQVDILRNLSAHHQYQDDLSLAYDYILQALDIATTYEVINQLPRLFIDKGIFIRDYERDYLRALDSFEKARLELDMYDNYLIKRNLYVNLASTYDLIGNKEIAEKYLLAVIDLSFDRDDPAGQLFSVTNYSEWLIDEQRVDEAGELMQDYLDTDIEGLPFSSKIHFRNVQAKLLLHDGNIEKAFELVSLTFDDIIDWMLQSSDHQTGHMQISSVFAESIRLITLLHQMNGDYTEALAVSGKVRNISRTGFYNNPALKSSLLTEEELIQDYNMGTHIQQLRNMYANANDQLRNRIRTELTNTMYERNQLINQAFPRYIESQYEELLRNPRKLLKKGEMVIYFSKFENQLFQFFVTRSGVDMISYPNDRDFHTRIADAIESFGYRTTDLNLMHNLYKTFFEGNIPDDIKHIYIVPDGDLYRIPFEILPVEPVDSPTGYGSANYFIENYSVSYLNTLSDLTKKQHGSNGYFETDIAGFGISNFSEAGHLQLADLPFSPIEVVSSINNLSSLDRHQMFIEENSTEANFKNSAGNARIIHLATHSRIIDNNPLFSSFYLYSDNTDSDLNSSSGSGYSDGVVRAFEIFDLNLDADLVFLSSCESGSGGYLQGTGILGFSRAFSYAGAKSLVLNLWPVRDQTSAEITPRFYDYLNNGMGKAEAIQQTKINYMNQRDSDPYLWGSFVIYGNTDPIISQRSTGIQIFIAAISLIGLFLLVSFIRRLMRI